MSVFIIPISNQVNINLGMYEYTTDNKNRVEHRIRGFDQSANTTM